ncbi:hypothetical protein HMI54_015804 [Coelomomyces lativittatus]|nr:hypothetical protein HMI54_015804 [Coelomomyces lativittatus]KAJ1514841.1 hypothetical protein HMI55_004290 [Coelomomyces lativittatus]KAJ1515067.1 hypothetical protein HMI56_006697 [Coelomomyces lativittatus]
MEPKLSSENLNRQKNEFNSEENLHKPVPSSISVSTFLSVQSRYHYLWSLNLSNQHLTQIPSFAELSALGYLNLSNNCLTFQTVQRTLRSIEPLLHLVLIGNQLIQSLQSEQRKFLIYTLPNLWCLDYIYITDKQAQSAIDYFELREGRHADIFLYHFLPFHPAFVPSRIAQKRTAICFDDWPTWPKVLFKHLPSSIEVPPVGSQLWHLGILSMDLQAEIYSQHTSMDNICKQWILEFLDQEVSCLHFLFITLLLLDPRFPFSLVHACITDLWYQMSPPQPFLPFSQFINLNKECLLKLSTILLALLEMEQEKTQFTDVFFFKSLHMHVRYLVGYYNDLSPPVPSRYITLELLLLCTVVQAPHILVEFYPNLVRILDPNQENSVLNSSLMKVHSNKLVEYLEEAEVFSFELKYEFCLEIESELESITEIGLKLRPHLKNFK